MNTETKNTEIKELQENQMQNVMKADEFRKDAFRVAIFGSARIKPNDKIFQEVMDLAKKIAKLEVDVVTGGGPGIMEAASLGHQMGTNGNSKSIGLTIELPWENEGNHHLDKQKHFQKFSNRLDTFMKLSNVVIVMPGGIGTCLEFFYTLQLTQVKHIHSIPILLQGKMWHQLYKWINKYPIADGLVSPQDIENVVCVNNNKDTFEIIKERLMVFKKEGPESYKNTHHYQL